MLAEGALAAVCGQCTLDAEPEDKLASSQAVSVAEQDLLSPVPVAWQGATANIV